MKHLDSFQFGLHSLFLCRGKDPEPPKGSATSVGEKDTLLNNVGWQGASAKEASSPTKAKARVTSPEKLPKDEERYDRV